MAPKHAATAAVFTDSKQLAYGVLTDVSVTGACIGTNSRLAPGSEVDLEISFYQQLHRYEIAARVVWNRLGGAHEKGSEFLPQQGLQFTLSSALQKSRLHALLAGEDFLEVFRLPATEFDLLQNGLAGEIAEGHSWSKRQWHSEGPLLDGLRVGLLLDKKQFFF